LGCDRAVALTHPLPGITASRHVQRNIFVATDDHVPPGVTLSVRQIAT
jgi:hypothetical protein